MAAHRFGSAGLFWLADHFARAPRALQRAHNGPAFVPVKVLLFVRCDVYCCGAVAPCVTAALLGRFLPRLGPPAAASGPFFRPNANGRRLATRLPPDKAATPRAGSRPSNPPAVRGPRRDEQSPASARIAARPCRARG